jgi:hypothetical protein
LDEISLAYYLWKPSCHVLESIIIIIIIPTRDNQLATPTLDSLGAPLPIPNENPAQLPYIAVHPNLGKIQFLCYSTFWIGWIIQKGKKVGNE